MNPQKLKKTLQQALTLHKSGQLEQAKPLYKAVLKTLPRDSDTNRLLGAIFLQQKNFSSALSHFKVAVASAPSEPDNHYFLARAYLDQNRAEEAEAPLRECLRRAPHHTNARISLAIVQMATGDVPGAIENLDRVLVGDPRSLDALVNKTEALLRLGRFEDAWTCVNAAVAIEPTSIDILKKRMRLHSINRDAHLTLRDVREVLRQNPTDVEALRMLMPTSIRLCDWRESSLLDRWSTEPPAQHGDIATGRDGFASLMRISWKGQAHNILAHARAANLAAQLPFTAPPTLVEQDRKLRIGYLSSDLRQHAVGQLVAGTIAAHDHDRFDIVNLSLLADDTSDALRQFIQSRCTENIFLDNLDEEGKLDIIQKATIDIIVDLNGWTRSTALPHLRHRPAPVQMTYLGYPGTTGAGYIDYILGDPSVTPPGSEAEFSEQVIRLPHCYLPFDRLRQPEPEVPSRAECGLPDAAIVFCGYNAAYKLTDDLADSWARILNRVPGSVLWLRWDSELQADNLHREFAARGIAPERLIFARREASFARHIGRQSHAVLFLDSFYYNAHTTGLDALWAGVPLVTKTGPSFAGRVGTSFLRTLGLTELITTSAEDYENLAVSLALDPARLAGIKQRIAAAHATSPLFDATQMARHLEAAYTTAWQRHCDGLPPASFDVAPIA